MIAAGEYLDVVQGAKRRGNTPAVLPQQATPENIQILTAQRVTEITQPAAHSYRNGINAI